MWFLVIGVGLVAAFLIAVNALANWLDNQQDKKFTSRKRIEPINEYIIVK